MFHVVTDKINHRAMKVGRVGKGGWGDRDGRVRGWGWGNGISDFRMGMGFLVPGGGVLFGTCMMWLKVEIGI